MTANIIYDLLIYFGLHLYELLAGIRADVERRTMAAINLAFASWLSKLEISFEIHLQPSLTVSNLMLD